LQSPDYETEGNSGEEITSINKMFFYRCDRDLLQKKKKVISLQSDTKEEHSIKILDDKGKKVRSMKDNFKIFDNTFTSNSDGSGLLKN
jgi:hypothetical protein